MRTVYPSGIGKGGIEVTLLQPGDNAQWDAFVKSNEQSTLYHLSGWRNVIEKAYRHSAYYLIASSRDKEINNSSGYIIGVLPLFHLKHFLFANTLVSMPFFDSGGILANDDDSASALLKEAIKLGKRLKVKSLELRHAGKLNLWNVGALGNAPKASMHLRSQGSNSGGRDGLASTPCTISSHKSRMILELPGSSELLMKSFKSKLRSQIKKPLKEGLVAKIGGIEMLDDFYRVFAENMRDLGSPVHSKNLIKIVFEEFPNDARIILVRKQDQPVACSVTIGFRKILENPWASALRRYSGLSPNMLLYWTMLEYACNEGFTHFDFGRSSPNEGTYKFKEQWGARPEPLHWHYLSLNDTAEAHPIEKSQFSKMIEYWKKLPVPVTKFVGPMIRKHIGL